MKILCCIIEVLYLVRMLSFIQFYRVILHDSLLNLSYLSGRCNGILIKMVNYLFEPEIQPDLPEKC